MTPTLKDQQKLIRLLQLAGTIEARRGIILDWARHGYPPDFLKECMRLAGLDEFFRFILPRPENDNHERPREA